MSDKNSEYDVLGRAAGDGKLVAATECGMRIDAAERLVFDTARRTADSAMSQENQTKTILALASVVDNERALRAGLERRVAALEQQAIDNQPIGPLGGQ